jgi:hydrogenase/urease accessory protein HupE
MTFPTQLRRSALRPAIAFFWLLALPLIAVAHPGHYHPDEVDEFDAFLHGLMHPLSGFVCLLFALALGWLVLSQMKSRRRVVVPVCLLLLGCGVVGVLNASL